MGLTDFFIDYIPMYNKFRAVSSILVIAEFTIPLLAIFALKEIFSKPEILKLKENRTGIIVTLFLTVGVALILAVAPGVFFSSFITAQEMGALKQGLPAEHLTWNPKSKTGSVRKDSNCIGIKCKCFPGF